MLCKPSLRYIEAFCMPGAPQWRAKPGQRDHHPNPLAPQTRCALFTMRLDILWNLKQPVRDVNNPYRCKNDRLALLLVSPPSWLTVKFFSKQESAWVLPLLL